MGIDTPFRERFLLCALSALVSLAGASQVFAETLVMPRELIDYAKARDCTSISEFFERPGSINPPYVYGILAGDEEESAAFWCKKSKPGEKPYLLLIKASNPKALADCPDHVEWRDVPGGLSVERHVRINLGEFRYVADRSRSIPSEVVQNATVLRNSYDGLTDRFVCHKGQWLVASTD
jgi:hypothetical protein